MCGTIPARANNARITANFRTECIFAAPTRTTQPESTGADRHGLHALNDRLPVGLFPFKLSSAPHLVHPPGQFHVIERLSGIRPARL
jgi:hypothetical protein